MGTTTIIARSTTPTFTHDCEDNMKLSESQQQALCTLLEYEGEDFRGDSPQDCYRDLNHRTVGSLVKKGLVSFENGPNHAGRYFGKITITGKGLKAVNDNAEPEEGDLVSYFRFQRPPRLGELVEWTHTNEVDGTKERFTGRIDHEHVAGGSVVIYFVAIATASVPLMTNATLYARLSKSDIRIAPKVAS